MKHDSSQMAIDPDHGPSLLVVDDDQRLCALLARYLTENGYQVDTAHSAAEAAQKLSPSLAGMVLDVMMPQESGIDFLARIRRGAYDGMVHLPVLMLTARSNPEDRIAGLETGCDDYLGKPFEPRELLLRVQNLLKRSLWQAGETARTAKDGVRILLGDLTFDTEKDALFNKWGDVVYVTSVELSLLRSFAAKPYEPLSRHLLAEQSGVFLSPRTIDVQITRLRRRIEPDPKKPIFLQTVRHQGYILKPSDILVPGQKRDQDGGTP